MQSYTSSLLASSGNMTYMTELGSKRGQLWSSLRQRERMLILMRISRCHFRSRAVWESELLSDDEVIDCTATIFTIFRWQQNAAFSSSRNPSPRLPSPQPVSSSTPIITHKTPLLHQRQIILLPALNINTIPPTSTRHQTPSPVQNSQSPYPNLRLVHYQGCPRKQSH